jgi:hypothetical protein
VKWADNVNSSTNGLVNYTLSNTQSGATVMQKIDTGTSAQGHTGLLINAQWASTSQKWVKVDVWTTWTWTWISIEGWNAATTPVLLALRASNSWSAWAWFNWQFLSTDAATWDWTTNVRNANNRILWDLRSKTLYNSTWNTARTENVFTLRHEDALASTATVNQSYSTWYIRRASSTLSAWAVINASGSVLKLENVATQTAGTLTDTVNVLDIIQDSDSTGSVINLTGWANNAAFNFSTNLTTTTAPVWASTYINVKVNGVAYRILAQAVA